MTEYEFAVVLVTGLVSCYWAGMKAGAFYKHIKNLSRVG